MLFRRKIHVLGSVNPNVQDILKKRICKEAVLCKRWQPSGHIWQYHLAGLLGLKKSVTLCLCTTWKEDLLGIPGLEGRLQGPIYLSTHTSWKKITANHIYAIMKRSTLMFHEIIRNPGQLYNSAPSDSKVFE